MESPVSLEANDAPCASGDLLNKDKAVAEESLLTSSSPTATDSDRPVKKQTRQWAAWTRQEEESFFTALRQVGKNFEMITCRVQSKNKDQVRHYYYRLVRRMNKLLGPEFSLDASNSKDTNAAMLRWWSLLEKYSCKASKLHLKPRRFKIFIEALEHQLLKDRKKNIKRRPSQNENCSSSSSAAPSQNKGSGHDTRSVKFVLVDSQNIQKVVSGKGSPLKRSVSSGTNRGNNKGDLSTAKTTRQRRKTGGASSAAYKRWEKAAIAGVSLVADAAEHLERTTINKKVLPDQGTSDESFPSTLMKANATDGQNVSIEIGKVSPPLSSPVSTQQQATEIGTQPSLKLKLQLFPIDEATRTTLEKEDHNPHLELTLRAGKKMTSVLEHLNRKWGKSSIASGELILFPYSARRDNLVGYQRWTLETVASAADVYASIGSPHVFRLRYGWFSRAELVSLTSGSPLAPFYTPDKSMSFNIWNSRAQNADLPAAPIRECHLSHEPEHLMEPVRDPPTPAMESIDPVPSFHNFRENVSEYVTAGTGNNSLEDGDNLGIISGVPLSAGDWADTLTNISIGELLTEAARMETDGSEPDVSEPPANRSDQFLEQVPFSCDSFDAAIAAHIAGRQDKSDLPSVQVSHASSIWDAEETCDAFAFQKNPPPKLESRSISSVTAPLMTCRQMEPTTSMSFRGLVEDFPGTRAGDVCEGASIDNCNSSANETDDPAKDLGGLTDTYWPDSLGPLELETAPSSRYQGQDLILGDSISLSGLNRLIANSLDAFQNCSFFGLDKAASMIDGRETAPLLDREIGSEV